MLFRDLVGQFYVFPPVGLARVLESGLEGARGGFCIRIVPVCDSFVRSCAKFGSFRILVCMFWHEGECGRSTKVSLDVWTRT